MNLNNLTTKGVLSLLLFTYFKSVNSVTTSAISELPYTLEYDDFYIFCERFGGETIKIPTIAEVNDVTLALTLYKNVNLKGKSFSGELNKIKSNVSSVVIKSLYTKIVNLLSNYEFNINSNEETLTDINNIPFILFILYKMQELDKYKTLCQLALTLNSNNFNRLCKRFGGIEIRVPAISEIKLLLIVLKLYVKINIEQRDFTAEFNLLDEVVTNYIKEYFKNITQEETEKLKDTYKLLIRKYYKTMCEVCLNYDFEKH